MGWLFCAWNDILDLRFFPEELHSVYYSTAHGRRPKTVNINVKRATFDETLARLNDLEKRDNRSGAHVNDEDENDENADEEDEEEDEAVYEEDELEDETDYNLNYFDNGEEYGDHDDGDGKDIHAFVVSSSYTDRILRWAHLLEPLDLCGHRIL